MDKTELAEICGIILGDGHIHKKENIIFISGSSEDLNYFTNRVMPLFLKNFGVVGKIYPLKGRNAYNLQFTNKTMLEFLLSECGLKRGRKINLTLPAFIKQNRDLQIAFLRGLFDTDGCLKFSKQRRSVNYYPRIQIYLLKSPLALELGQLFSNLDFKFSCWRDDNSRGFGPTDEMICYHISGKKALLDWFKLIRPANLVHTTKFLLWVKLGYCQPKISLNQREELLSKEF